MEFKRPSLNSTREHEAQAIGYRDVLGTRFDPIDILLIGVGRAIGSDAGFSDPRLTVTSYASVVSKARTDPRNYRDSHLLSPISSRNELHPRARSANQAD